MTIKRLVIENFKSIERIELIEPNPFTVFVGPNGSGKSNIFEALEFMNLATKAGGLVANMFGGVEKFVNRKAEKKIILVSALLDSALLKLVQKPDETNTYNVIYSETSVETQGKAISRRKNTNQFLINFNHLFIKNNDKVKYNNQADDQLSLSANNLESVLKRILQNSMLRDEIFEWLGLFVPGFKAVEVDDHDELHWFEESSDRYFTKDLISDGTYYIIALLTAVYQSDDQPQFLCIEEPENGLHPQVARELVDFFRLMCEERGHYIWLNTHSPYMVSRVKPEELVVVDKVNGATQIKQFSSGDFDGMRMDDAWLTNALNGGKAW